MDTEKKIVIVVMIISVFVFVVAFSSLYVQTNVLSGTACGCAIPIWLFIPLLSSIGLLIGSLVYYLLYSGREKEPCRLSHAEPKKIALEMARMLPGDEAKLVMLLVENGGTMTQADLMKKSGINKVQVHRVLKRLEMRKFILKERDRKVNTITIVPKVRELLG